MSHGSLSGTSFGFVFLFQTCSKRSSSKVRKRWHLCRHWVFPTEKVEFSVTRIIIFSALAASHSSKLLFTQIFSSFWHLNFELLSLIETQWLFHVVKLNKQNKIKRIREKGSYCSVSRLLILPHSSISYFSSFLILIELDSVIIDKCGCTCVGSYCHPNRIAPHLFWSSFENNWCLWGAGGPYTL